MARGMVRPIRTLEEGARRIGAGDLEQQIEVCTGDEVEALANQFNEMALQTAFVGTQLPLELSRKSIKVIVLTGIHLDWCIEGNARAARDNGYLPIVIGDACACQKPEQEPAAMQRINNFFAPVISSDSFVQFLRRPA